MNISHPWNSIQNISIVGDCSINWIVLDRGVCVAQHKLTLGLSIEIPSAKRNRRLIF
mgnify:CR=1 FL=1